MANISSLMSSTNSTSSLYGNKNIISGLASGMDTESMIENSVSGYKAKIRTLQQKMTKLQWQQDMYRGILDKMVNFREKYISYTSSNNLSSPGFFNSASKISALGENASKIAASGKTNSSVQINSVSSLAKAARYSTEGGDILARASSKQETTEPSFQGKDVYAQDAADWSNAKVSTVSGSISLKYGNNNLSVRLDANEVYESASDLVEGINKKLADAKITYDNGATVAASEKIRAVLGSNHQVTFTTVGGDTGNTLYIQGMSDEMKTAFGIAADTDFSTANLTSFQVDESKLSKEVPMSEYLKDQSLTVTLDGTSKTVQFSDLLEKNSHALDSVEQLAEAVGNELSKSFGQRLTVGTYTGADGGTRLAFGVDSGSNSILQVSSTASNRLGLGENGLTSYTNPQTTLGNLLQEANWDENGNTYLLINEDRFTADENGNKGIQISKDDTIATLMNKINASDAGVNVSFSQITNKFVFNAKDTGAASRIAIEEGSLAAQIFGATVDAQGNFKTTDYEEGQDAVLNVTINGENRTLTRSSNQMDLDGMTVTLKGEFSSGEPVTFASSADADKIVDAIKSFVEDYNAMVTELRNTYATMPGKKSDGSKYEPLTEEDRADMSETAIKNYEDKAKQGILFADDDLSKAYQMLTSAISPTGKDANMLDQIGINSDYSEGLTTLSIDEEKLRSVLESDPDKVADAFSKTVSGGASSNGIMYHLKSALDTYASTSIGSPGILVSKAGTTKSSYSLLQNDMQTKIGDVQTQIEKWQTKMSDKIDYYTRQYSMLEQLINQMNSQSSALSGLMGG